MAQVVNSGKKIWESLEKTVSLDGTTAKYDSGLLTVTGPKGVVSKVLMYPRVYVKVVGDNIVIGTKHLSKREKKMIHTYFAHINNMILGVKEGFEYKLVVVYAKFPITVEMKGKEFIVKNLLGEKVPRRLKISDDVKVDVKGKDVVVSGIDIEKCGQVASSIEQLTRINHLDRRVIQDGIFITKKPHKEYN